LEQAPGQKGQTRYRGEVSFVGFGAFARRTSRLILRDHHRTNTKGELCSPFVLVQVFITKLHHRVINKKQ
jgi:hypothetical protein